MIAEPFDVDSFLAGYQPKRATVRLCMRPDIEEQHARLEAEMIEAAQRDIVADDAINEAPRYQALAAQVLELEQEHAGAWRAFTFQALGSRQWIDLLRAHPATDEDRARGDDAHPDTFMPAAVAACSVSPKLTSLQANALMETLSEAHWDELWRTARDVNTRGDGSPKSLAAIALRRLNAASSTIAPPEGSLAASS